MAALDYPARDSPASLRRLPDLVAHRKLTSTFDGFITDTPLTDPPAICFLSATLRNNDGVAAPDHPMAGSNDGIRGA